MAIYWPKEYAAEYSSPDKRWAFFPPEESRDHACFEIFNDKTTMLPHLAILCPMSLEDMIKRRQTHRVGFINKSSWFVDIVLLSTGELIGTSGFRLIDAATNEAEWGVVISHKFQRQGICQESLNLSIQYAHSIPDINYITASTLLTNKPMMNFLTKNNFKQVIGGHDGWQKFTILLQNNTDVSSFKEIEKNSMAKENFVGLIDLSNDMLSLVVSFLNPQTKSMVLLVSNQMKDLIHFCCISLSFQHPDFLCLNKRNRTLKRETLHRLSYPPQLGSIVLIDNSMTSEAIAAQTKIQNDESGGSGNNDDDNSPLSLTVARVMNFVPGLKSDVQLLDGQWNTNVPLSSMYHLRERDCCQLGFTERLDGNHNNYIISKRLLSLTPPSSSLSSSSSSSATTSIEHQMKKLLMYLQSRPHLQTLNLSGLCYVLNNNQFLALCGDHSACAQYLSNPVTKNHCLCRVVCSDCDLLDKQTLIRAEQLLCQRMSTQSSSSSSALPSLSLIDSTRCWRAATPNPCWTAREVAELQLRAMQEQLTPEEGIANAFQFASPENQTATGPLSRFTTMMQEGFNCLINCDAYELFHVKSFFMDKQFRDENEGRENNVHCSLFLVHVIKQGKSWILCWQLSKDSDKESEYFDCWFTDVVNIDHGGVSTLRSGDIPSLVESYSAL